MNTPRKNPYIGPRTFLKEEGHLFFGREREARDLLSLVVSQHLVLFYAQSGAGKSSIVNTRLIPNLEERGFEVFPVGRVSGDLAPEGADSNVYTFNLMRKLTQHEADSNILAGLSLSEFLANLNSDEKGYFYDPDLSQHRPESYMPWRHALVIDQFEELFSTHPEAWEKREDFFCQIAAAMEDDPYLWVVLVMREDYIASLDPYAHLLPGGLRARYYMQRLGREAALKAIKNPVEALRPFAPNVAEKLVDDLCSIKIQKPDGSPGIQPGQYVEPVQLQVVCYSLWENLPEEGTEITEEDLREVGDVNQSLGRYYAGRVKAVTADPKLNVKERSIREWFEQSLITAGGIRNMVLQEPNKKSGDLLEDRVIQALQSDLVRAEKRSGATWYELTHDRLVEPILADNKAWFEENSSLLQRQAKLWNDQGRNDSLLLRDQALLEAVQWASGNEDELTQTDRDLIRASQEQQDQIEKRQTIERMKLEQAEEQARSATRARRLTRIAFSLLGLALIAVGFAAWAAVQAKQAENRANTTASQLATREAEAQELKNAALARELAGQAADALDKQLDLSILLGLEAFNKNLENPEAEIIPQVENALFNSMQRSLRLRGYLATSGDPANSLQYSPDGRLVAVLKENGITYWDISKDMASVTIPDSKFVDQYFFSPDSSKLIYRDYKGITFWDVKNSKSLNNTPMNGHTGEVTDVVFSAGGENFATVGENGDVTLWDAEQKSLIFKPDQVAAHAFSPDGTKFAILDREGGTKIYGMADVRQQGDQITMDAGTATALAFNQAGDKLAIGDENGNIVLWDLISNKQADSFPSGTTSVQSLNFSSDGKFLVSQTVDGIKTWSLDNHAQSGDTIVTTGRTFFSPNGKAFAEVGNSGQIFLHDIPESAPHKPIPGTSCAFSIDGSILAVFNQTDKSLKLFDTSSGEPTGDPFPEQSDVVVNIVFSRDGNLLVTASPDGNTRVWDVPSRQLKLKNTGGKIPVGAFSFSPDGNVLVVGRENGSLTRWNLNVDKTEKIETNYQGSINSITLSPSGQYVYSTANDGTVLINLETLKTVGGVFPGSTITFNETENLLAVVDSSPDTGECSLWSLPTAKNIKDTIPCTSATFSPRGNRLAITNYADETKTNTTTTIWNALSGQQTGDSYRGYLAAFSPDGESIAISDPALSVITILNTSTGETVGEPFSGNNVYFSPAGDAVLLTDYNSNLTVMDRTTGKIIRDTSTSNFIGFSPDGNVLVLQDYSTGGVIFWDVEKMEQIGDPILNVTSSTLSLDGRRLAITTYSDTTVWDTMTGKRVGSLARSGLLQFSPDGDYIVSSDYYGSYTSLWNLSTDEKIDLSANQTFQPGPGISPFSPDGKYLLLYDRYTYAYTFWSVATGQQVGGRLAGHAGWICGGLFNESGDVQIAFQNNINNYCNPYLPTGDSSRNAFLLSPNEETYAAFSIVDGTVSLWGVESPPSIPGDAVQDLQEDIGSVQLSPDGHTLAVSTRDNMLLWDVDKASQIGELPGVHVRQPNSVSLSPDGELLAITYGDNSLSLWNVDKNEQIGKPIYESFYIFSPDGRILVTSPSYQVFTLWDTSTGKRIGQPLSGETFQFTRDSHYLIFYSYYVEGNIRIFDATTGEQVGDPIEGSFIGTGPGATIVTRNATSILLQDIDDSMKTQSFIPYDSRFYFLLSPNGKCLAVASDGPFIIWDMESHKQIGEIDGHPGDLLGFSPDGQFIYFNNYLEGGLILYQATYPNTRILDDPVSGDTLSFSPDGTYFAAYYSYYYDQAIKLYSSSTGDQVDQIDVGGSLQGFGNGGKLLITMKDWKKAEIWETEDFTKEPTIIDYPGVFTNMALSQDGTTLAVYGNTGVLVMNLSDPARPSKKIKETTSVVQQMVFSPDGKMFATIGTDGLVLWDVNSQSPLGETIISKESFITNVRFSPDSKSVVYMDGTGNIFKVQPATNSVSDENRLPILNTSCAVGFDPQGNLLAARQSGRKIQILNGNTDQQTDLDLDGSCTGAMAFSPDGASFAYNAGDRTYIFTSDAQGKPFATRREIVGDKSPYSNLTFVSDGKILAMKGADGRVYFWDIQSRSLVFASGEAADLQSASNGKVMFFLPSENQLVSMDFAAETLKSSFAKWKEGLCTKAGRNFSATEWQQYFPEEDYRPTCSQWPAGE